MIVQIWGFVVTECVREIGDMQEKICNRIAGGVILDLIQWSPKKFWVWVRINIIEDLKTADADLGLIRMEHTEYFKDVLTTLKVLTFFL